MLKKVQIIIYIVTILLSLTLAIILFSKMNVCEYCSRTFCFNTCEESKLLSGENITISGGSGRVNPPKTTQNTTRLAETDEAGDDYLQNIYFIGDSRTVAYEFYGISTSKIFAQNSLTHVQAMTQDVVWLNENKMTTIEDAIKVTVPDTVIVNFGINGAGWMADDEFKTTYESFLDSLLEASPDTIFIIESILPVSAEYEVREDGIRNERIDELNEILYDIAKDKGLYYLAANEVLKADNNALDSLYSSDGLHYNNAAYDVLLDYIRTHAVYRK